MNWGALKDWPTTIPAIIVVIVNVLKVVGVIDLPEPIVSQITLFVLGLTGWAVNGWKDIPTTITGVLSSMFAILLFFNVAIDPKLVTALELIVGGLLTIFGVKQANGKRLPAASAAISAGSKSK